MRHISFLITLKEQAERSLIPTPGVKHGRESTPVGHETPSDKNRRVIVGLSGHAGRANVRNLSSVSLKRVAKTMLRFVSIFRQITTHSATPWLDPTRPLEAPAATRR